MRVKRLGVSMELFRTLLAQDNVIPATRVTNGLPPDAVVCGVSLTNTIIWLDITSSTFDEVEQGKLIPDLVVTFETQRGASA